MTLKDRLKAQIAATGPLTVAQYMTACLWDPKDGYYAAHPRLGEDFITAPTVSQMFGELIGLWAAEVWAALGRPPRVILAEVGPGDGSLMHDALRAARAAPGFLSAVEVWLVEASTPLAALQRQRIGERARWCGALADLPSDLPLILIANEVLDCLPAQQFVSAAQGWAERVVGLDGDEELAWGLKAVPPGWGKGWDRGEPTGSEVDVLEALLPPAPSAERVLATPAPLSLPHPPGGRVLEISPAQTAFAAEIAHRVAATGGAALLIDYGPAEPGFGDTLQAVRKHRKVDPLACPGEADLTVHADFPAVLAAAREAGARTTAIFSQAEFLRRLGIEERAAALSAARPDQAPAIARQLHRLTATDQMGELFKAAAVYAPAGLAPPAFGET